MGETRRHGRDRARERLSRRRGLVPRLRRATSPGYGFVDEETPELAIAVVPSKRGHGIGDELLQELIAKARAAGYERLSLSVEPGNPARKLYERHGFSVIDEGAEAWTMVASLA